MTSPTHTEDAIRAAMDHLIERATRFDVDALETITTTGTSTPRWS